MSEITDTDQGDLHHEITTLLVQLFDLSAEQITPDARLYEDLDLDSIDAVDLVVHLQKKTGQKVKPEVFKSVRTVQDVFDVVQQLLQDKQSSAEGHA